MKFQTGFLLLSLFATALIISCSDDEETEQTLTERIAGNYSGTYETFNCALVQTENNSQSAAAEVTMIEEGEISVHLSSNGSELFTFSAFEASDTTFSAIPIVENGDSLLANIFLTDEFRILISDNCLFGSTNVVTSRFVEN